MQEDIVEAADGTGIHQTIQRERTSLHGNRANKENLLSARARELSHRFGTFGDCVLRQFTRQDQAYRGLDLT